MTGRQIIKERFDVQDLVRRIVMSDAKKTHYMVLPNLEIPAALRILSEENDEDGFRRVVEAHLDLLERVNSHYKPQREIRAQALDFISFMVLVGDAGYLGVGLPTEVPEGRGYDAEKMFDKLYGPVNHRRIFTKPPIRVI